MGERNDHRQVFLGKSKKCQTQRFHDNQGNLFNQNTVKLGYNELGYNELGYNELGC